MTRSAPTRRPRPKARSTADTQAGGEALAEQLPIVIRDERGRPIIPRAWHLNAKAATFPLPPNVRPPFAGATVRLQVEYRVDGWHGDYDNEKGVWVALGVMKLSKEPRIIAITGPQPSVADALVPEGVTSVKVKLGTGEVIDLTEPAEEGAKP
jgi:hypothetical protein